MSSYSDSNWRIDWADLRMGKCIGRGGFGEVGAVAVVLMLVIMMMMMTTNAGEAEVMIDMTQQVYKGSWRGTDVAVKRLLHQDIGKDSGMLDAFCQEVCVASPRMSLITYDV